MGLMFGDMIRTKDIHMPVITIEMMFGTIWEVKTMCREDEVWHLA